MRTTDLLSKTIIAAMMAMHTLPPTVTATIKVMSESLRPPGCPAGAGEAVAAVTAATNAKLDVLEFTVARMGRPTVASRPAG